MALDSKDSQEELTTIEEANSFDGFDNDTVTKGNINKLENDDSNVDGGNNNYTASGWMEIEKLLDSDASSIANKDKQNANYGNRSIDISNSIASNRNVLQSTSTEDDNSLDETQNVMDNIMNDNHELSDIDTSDMFGDWDDNAVTRENAEETVNKTISELSNAVQLDCMKLFNRTEGDIMASNNDCVRLGGRSFMTKPTVSNISMNTAHPTYNNDTQNVTTEITNLHMMPSNDTSKITEGSNLNSTQNSGHDLSIIEVQMLPDDYPANDIEGNIRNVIDRNNETLKNVTSSNIEESKAIENQMMNVTNDTIDTEAHHRHIMLNKDANNTSNNTELTILHAIPNNDTDDTSNDIELTNHNTTSNNNTNELNNVTETILSDTTLHNDTHDANNDTKVTNRNTIQSNSTSNGLNIIEIQMLAGDVTNTNTEGSKRHIPFHIEKGYHKKANNIKGSNVTGVRRHTIINHVDDNKRNVLSNITANVKEHHVVSKNITKDNKKKKKHHIASHNNTNAEAKRSKHHDLHSNTTHNTIGKKGHTFANNTDNTTTNTNKEHGTPNNKKESKRNKVVHREKIKGKLASNKKGCIGHSIKTKSVKTPQGIASKRRLVSNHVPFHRENNDTNFKNLNKDSAKKKKGGSNANDVHKTNSAGPLTYTTTQTTSNTDKPKPGETVGKANTMPGNKTGNTTDGSFEKRPTIPPRGINKSKAGVLHTDTEEEEQKVGNKVDPDAEYVKDEKFPNLGIFRHSKHPGQLLLNPVAMNQTKEVENSNINEDVATTRKTVSNNSLIFYNGTSNNNSDSVPNVVLKRILCFGDSLTKGMYAKGEIYHPYTIKLRELFGDNKHVNYNIINHGMNGECVSKTMKNRLTEDLESLPKLDLVVILGGTNDLLHEDCARKIDLFDEIKTLHTLVREKGYKSVVVTIPESHVFSNGTDKMSQAEYNDAIEDVNQKLRMYAANEKIPICDLADEFPRHTLPGKTNMASMWDDKVHPSAKGYDRIGEIIYDDIKGFV